MTRTTFWSPLLLAVALAPAFLHLANCGNPHLTVLEVEASAVNRVVGFGTQTHQYSLWTDGADTIVVRATTAEPAAVVDWRLFIDGVFQDFQPLGTGGGEVTLTVPPGTPSEVQLDVNHNGEIGRYTLDINPLCAADECDDANQCTSDACVGGTCEFTSLLCTIDFDDGMDFDPVDSHYAAQGVTFDTNTVWVPNGVDDFYIGGDATAPLSISLSGYDPTVDDPLIVTFAHPQSSVSILAVNVGEAGGRLDAYDAVTGGTLVGFAEAYGTTRIGETGGAGCPAGSSCHHEERLLSVSAPSILRIEVYRPIDSGLDHVHFDNLTFGP